MIRHKLRKQFCYIKQYNKTSKYCIESLLPFCNSLKLKYPKEPNIPWSDVACTHKLTKN